MDQNSLEILAEMFQISLENLAEALHKWAQKILEILQEFSQKILDLLADYIWEFPGNSQNPWSNYSADLDMRHVKKSLRPLSTLRTIYVWVLRKTRLRNL